MDCRLDLMILVSIERGINVSSLKENVTVVHKLFYEILEFLDVVSFFDFFLTRTSCIKRFHFFFGLT